MKTAALLTTLVFYDGPELFIAKDKFGTHYLSLAVPEADRVLYVSVPLTYDDLGAVLDGSAQLRDLMRRNADDGWYISDPLVEGFQRFTLSLREGTMPLAFLPDPGFDLSSWLPEPSELAELASVRGRPVIGIRVDPPEAGSSATIRTNTLAALLIEFQKLVRHARGKLRQKGKSVLPDRSVDYTLNTLAFGKGSFRVYFESAGESDLFGSNEIEMALRLINDVLEDASNTDRVVEQLRQMRGHFVASLRRMLEILDANSTFLEIDWTTPGEEVRRTRISRSAVGPLLARLKETESLSKEIRVFSGCFLRADVSSGSWKLKTASEGEEVSGRSRDSQLLSGVVIEKGMYSVVCEEEIEEDLVSGREKHVLTATDVSPVGSGG